MEPTTSDSHFNVSADLKNQTRKHQSIKAIKREAQSVLGEKSIDTSLQFFISKH